MKLEVRHRDAGFETSKSAARVDVLEVPAAKSKLPIPYLAPTLDATSHLLRFSGEFPVGLSEEQGKERNRRGLAVVDDVSWHLAL